MSGRIEAGDEFRVEYLATHGRGYPDITGTVVEWRQDGADIRTEVHDVMDSDRCRGKALVSAETCTPWHVDNGTVVTVVTPPPVKVIQPDEPTALGTLVRIEGDEKWVAVLADEDDYYFRVHPLGGYPGWKSWEEIIEFAAGRQIVVSSAPVFPEAEPPETITEWLEDDTALHGWVWRDCEGDYWRRGDGQWLFGRSRGYLPGCAHEIPREYFPLTRVGRA